jgi:hypothetical protein
MLIPMKYLLRYLLMDMEVFLILSSVESEKKAEIVFVIIPFSIRRKNDINITENIAMEKSVIIDVNELTIFEKVSMLAKPLM